MSSSPSQTMTESPPIAPSFPSDKAREWRYPLRIKGSSPVGTSTFISLRLAGVYLQWALLRHGYAARFISFLGGRPVAIDSITSTSGVLALMPTTLSQLPPYYTLVVSLAGIAALKHILWVSYLTQARIEPLFSCKVAGLNMQADTVNTILAVWALTANVPGTTLSNLTINIGILLFLLGVYVELASEFTRRVWKGDPSNAGKLYSGGLLGYARHINYAGFALWRAVHSLVTGGLPWGMVTGGFFAWDMSTRAVPELELHFDEKYKEKHEELKRKVPYLLIPGIY